MSEPLRVADDRPPTVAPAHGLARVLTVVAILYVAIGSVLGFVQGGLAPILRAQGVPLASLQWVYALYLPFGVAFLWAPWLDARRLRWLGHRTGWIVAAQLVAVAATLCIAARPGAPVAWLFALGLVATTAVATMDLSLDALSVEQTPPSGRTLVAAAKMGGMAVGLLLGGGVLVWGYPWLGWRLVFVALAAILALSVLSVALLVEADRATPRGAGRSLSGWGEAWRDRAMRARLLATIALTVMLMMLFNFNRLLLVDLGMTLQRIGALLGTLVPAANLAASVAAGWAARRWRPPTICATGALACIASVAVLAVAASRGDATLAATGAVLVGAASAWTFIGMGGAILGWAAGRRPATVYALFYSSGRLVGTFGLLGVPGLIAATGWPAFYAGAGTLFAVAAAVFVAMLPRSGAVPAEFGRHGAA
ncbi:MFS transporter [Burkholderia sp. MSMB1835]|uniref:MFS transporter n=1 Tax=Burkholderia sp. MSMB1835 TaxID=1637876 RepID=UPI00075A31A0|nr:MFS transporter [Burkholderia sp. MSMB1835]KVL40464.1 MFS transporter [Burkholderia sp. MSMB1835]